MNRLNLFALLALIGLFACHHEVDVEADVEAIKAYLENAVEKYNQGEAEAWVNCFADDAIVMPPNSPEITNRTDLLAFINSIHKAIRPELTSTPVEIEILGDWAYVRTHVQGKFFPRSDGDPIPVDSKEIVILKRQPSGEWIYYRLIGNSNLPLADND